MWFVSQCWLVLLLSWIRYIHPIGTSRLAVLWQRSSFPCKRARFSSALCELTGKASFTEEGIQPRSKTANYTGPNWCTLGGGGGGAEMAEPRNERERRKWLLKEFWKKNKESVRQRGEMTGRNGKEVSEQETKFFFTLIFFDPAICFRCHWIDDKCLNSFHVPYNNLE